jgi:hypothetical protein
MTYIGFNPKYYSDIKKSEESLEEGEKQGWNPKGANTIDYVLTHEFGHSVKFGLERMYSRSVTPHMAYGKKTLISNIIAAFVDHHKASDKLSKYAMKNEEEAWAESFAAIHHSPPRTMDAVHGRPFRAADSSGRPDEQVLRERNGPDFSRTNEGGGARRRKNRTANRNLAGHILVLPAIINS